MVLAQDKGAKRSTGNRPTPAHSERGATGSAHSSLLYRLDTRRGPLKPHSAPASQHCFLQNAPLSKWKYMPPLKPDDFCCVETKKVSCHDTSQQHVLLGWQSV